MQTRAKGTPDARIAELICETTAEWRDVKRACRISEAVSGARLLPNNRFLVLNEVRFAYFKRSMRAKEPAECPMQA